MDKLFDKKPSYFKLIYEIRIEKAIIVNNYNKRQAGLLGHEIKKNTRQFRKLYYEWFFRR